MNVNTYAPMALSKAQENTLLRSVYNWMMVGLFLSGLTAYFAANNSAVQQMIFGNSFAIWFLFLGELALVFVISGGMKSMSSSTAGILFVLFAVINGLTISSIFIVYTMQSISTTFFITALTFGATSFYGYVTKTDLTSIGKYLFMALIGIIIATLVNFFVHSSTLNWIVSYIGIIIFVGLTAYDTQKIKNIGEKMLDRETEQFKRVAIIGALALYLDFINLFLILLRFTGGGRD